jgi:HTH-type transcriptional regulator / antitoxin HigA
MIDETQFRTPGQLIQALLDQRGWNQRVLAIVLKHDETTIGKIINGKRQVDAEMAIALQETFQVPAEKFLELQKSYELATARFLLQADPERATRAKLFGSLPVAEMIKRGWIDVGDIRDFPRVESQLTKFFGVQSVDEIEAFPHAAKKNDSDSGVTPTQMAWLYRVKEIAAEMLTARYSERAVEAAIPKLKELLVSAPAVRKVPRILEECGIRYVIVEALAGSKIDGVCFWIDDAKPVIGMSLRYDRIDNFWFVLRHELEHVIKQHGRESAMLDVELEGGRADDTDQIAEEERIANRAASEFCTPKKSLESFIARKAPIFTERDIIGFANTLSIHPGVVAGQLRHKLGIYNRFANHLVKVRSAVAPGAMVDGWGNVVPVGA